LRHQLRWLQQGTQRNNTSADARERRRDLYPLHAVRHDQTDPGSLATPASMNAAASAGGFAELGVADRDRVSMTIGLSPCCSAPD